MRKNFISTREIADNDTTISSTRWAFASVVKVDLCIVVITIIAGIAGHFLDKPIPNEFYSSVSLLLGVITGIIGGNKALQGFETKKDDKPIKSEDLNEKRPDDKKDYHSDQHHSDHRKDYDDYGK